MALNDHVQPFANSIIRTSTAFYISLEVEISHQHPHVLNRGRTQAMVWRVLDCLFVCLFVCLFCLDACLLVEQINGF